MELGNIGLKQVIGGQVGEYIEFEGCVAHKQKCESETKKSLGFVQELGNHHHVGVCGHAVPEDEMIVYGVCMSGRKMHLRDAGRGRA